MQPTAACVEPLKEVTIGFISWHDSQKLGELVARNCSGMLATNRMAMMRMT
jgi:hypothetical protein